MNKQFKRFGAGILLSSCALIMSNSASAGAIIYNTGDAATATVALGINDQGHLNLTTGNITLNATATGLATKIMGLAPGTSGDGGDGWYDATSPGCLCEGWGAAANGKGSEASVDSGGIQNLTLDSFSSTASTATSITHLTSLPDLEVTHFFAPSSANSNLFEVKVTLTNKSTTSALSDVRYTRAMDWDIPLDEFDEYVTIQGTASTTDLLFSSDDGFAHPNPLSTDRTTDIASCGFTTDFVDCGPDDHGALFDFGFGDLAAGESKEFSIFYGATANETDALAAIGDIGAELYSFGQAKTDPTGGTPATYIFAFSGVGGTVLIPPTSVPEPASILLFGLGAFGIGAVRRRKSSK